MYIYAYFGSVHSFFANVRGQNEYSSGFGSFSLSLVRARTRAKQTDRSRQSFRSLCVDCSCRWNIYRTQLLYAHSNLGAEWNRAQI